MTSCCATRGAFAIRLSICIPTYNFGPFIGETLESIVSQLQEGVEIVVLDGGSSDDTAAVVEAIQQRCPVLRYERRPERGGIDRDIGYNVAAARGEYCWLFCADDIMRPGALGRMLENLESDADVYLCGLTLCSFEMEPIAEHRVSRIKVPAVYDLARADERETYFRSALTTTAFFSFAGSLCFRKSRWDEIGLDERFVGSAWAHVARFFQMMPAGLRIHYLPDSYLLKRTENDSFMDKGLINRYALAIDGYDRLAAACFPEGSMEARHVRRAVTNEFPPWGLLDLKFTSEPSQGPEVDRLASRAYADPTPRNRLYRNLYSHTPRAAFRAAQEVYRKARATVNRFARPSTA